MLHNLFKSDLSNFEFLNIFALKKLFENHKYASLGWVSEWVGEF